MFTIIGVSCKTRASMGGCNRIESNIWFICYLYDPLSYPAETNQQY